MKPIMNIARNITWGVLVECSAGNLDSIHLPWLPEEDRAEMLLD